MNSTRLRGPLTEAEKKWRQEFINQVQSMQGRAVLETPFLDPLQLELAQKVLEDYRDLSYTAFGGYPDSERTILRIFPSGQKGALPEVTVLLLKGLFDEERLNRRDLLGAILALGLRREQVGDILMLPGDRAVIFVPAAEAGFICARLNRVGDMAVECSVADVDQLKLPSESGREICGTVAGTRLDAVLSLGFGLSRAKTALLIKGGLVNVNWRLADAPAIRVREGDIISLQGRGRLELLSMEGETKKGRIRLKLKKFGLYGQEKQNNC